MLRRRRQGGVSRMPRAIDIPIQIALNTGSMSINDAL